MGRSHRQRAAHFNEMMATTGWMPQARWLLLTYQRHSEWIFTAT
jgi:hypothetical protein